MKHEKINIKNKKNFVKIIYNNQNFKCFYIFFYHIFSTEKQDKNYKNNNNQKFLFSKSKKKMTKFSKNITKSIKYLFFNSINLT